MTENSTQTDIDVARFPNLVDLFEDAFKRYASCNACSSLGHTVTYAELDRLSGQFASWLQNDSGLELGDRVAVQMPNLIQYFVVVLGVLRAGMVVVNTNPLYTEREAEHQFNDAQVKLLVVQANVARNASLILSRTNIQKVVVTELADLHPQPRRFLINFIAKYVKKLIPPFKIPGALSLRDVLNEGSHKSFQKVDIKTTDLALLQYTGGTTGVAKGAMLSHGNLVANVLQCYSIFGGTELLDAGDIYVQPLPVYHVYAFTMFVYSLFAGAHTVFILNPRDLSSIVKVFDTYRPKLFCGLNTLFVALSHDTAFQQLDFSELKVTLSAAMVLTENAANEWERVTGCKVSEGYGLTETSPAVTVNSIVAPQLGTIGLPLPRTEVRVLDDEGNVLGFDRPGELCVRGPQVMMGYWQRPEATSKVIDADGWFATGDVAIIQPDGYLRIVDRKKDMIVVSGFNVYPNELEDVLSKHPDVLECAAVGIPDGTFGEVVKIFVVKENPGLTEQQVRDYCREYLTAYKVPRQVEFRDELPKNTVGKILRRELRAKVSS